MWRSPNAVVEHKSTHPFRNSAWMNCGLCSTENVRSKPNQTHRPTECSRHISQQQFFTAHLSQRQRARAKYCQASANSCSYTYKEAFKSFPHHICSNKKHPEDLLDGIMKVVLLQLPWWQRGVGAEVQCLRQVHIRPYVESGTASFNKLQLVR